ncbi:transposase [Pseudomonas sp. SDM007_2]|uniref:transposase n=1 Tax=Pseudomonas hygromyciniae TaxID=2812000 RepID=UPI0019689B5F|nr:transposase [Pseudomonas hygromyciniae]
MNFPMQPGVLIGSLKLAVAGCQRADDRLMLNDVFCARAVWGDMPQRFGPWPRVYQRLRNWRNCGVFNQMLMHLHVRLNVQSLIDLETWMIDHTSAHAAQTHMPRPPAPN